MATRQSVEEYLQKAEDVFRYAKEQFSEAQKQEHYNDTEFTKAQQQLEETYQDLQHLSLSANSQQREQLYRMGLQLQQIQNDMMLQEH